MTVINTEDWQPVGEILKSLPVNMSSVWFYEMIKQGRVNSIQPWRRPLLIEVKSVKKLIEELEEKN
jgi:hypothetical protein